MADGERHGWPEEVVVERLEDEMVVLGERSKSPGEAIARQQAPSGLQPAEKGRCEDIPDHLCMQDPLGCSVTMLLDKEMRLPERAADDLKREGDK